jgi:ATP-dependent protease ClpP protease subunit
MPYGQGRLKYLAVGSQAPSQSNKGDNGSMQKDNRAAPPSKEKLLFHSNVSLYGLIDTDAVNNALAQLREVRDGKDALIFEVTTTGGDADAARRIALEVKLVRDVLHREAYFVGKSFVYSAGATLMSAFPREQRFVTADTILLIHERRLQKEVSMDGPIRANLQIIKEQLKLLETAERLEMEGFDDIAEGSTLSGQQLYDRAKENLYLTAREALDLGLIGGIL